MTKVILFWTHVVVGVFGASIGFYLSLPIVLALIVAHRLHMLIFRGCVISRYQQYLGHFPQHVNFLEVVANKIFKRDFSRLQVVLFDLTLAVIPISVATVRLVVS